MPASDILADLQRWLSAEKTMATAASWRKSGRQLAFAVPLDIDGVTQQGLILRGTCTPAFPDRDVVFQLEYHPAAGRGGAIERIEWQPLRSHTNKGLGPEEHRFRLIEGSQVHPFDLNRALGFAEMVRSNLPIAVPLRPEPADFAGLLGVIAERLRIVDAPSVPDPPWQPELPSL